MHVLIPDRQRDDVDRLALRAGLTTSEVVRRAIDYALRAEHVNEYLPALSGRIETGA